MELTGEQARVWHVLTNMPGTYHLKEMMHEVKLSKSALLQVLYQLEDMNLLSLEEEDGI